MGYNLLIAVHIIVSLLLIIVILLQSGKGGGMASSFGGSGTSLDNYFGGRGAGDILNKITTTLAIIFMLLCVVHSFAIKPDARAPESVLESMAGQGGGVPATIPMDQQGSEPAQELPVAPAEAPAAK